MTRLRAFGSNRHVALRRLDTQFWAGKPQTEVVRRVLQNISIQNRGDVQVMYPPLVQHEV